MRRSTVSALSVLAALAGPGVGAQPLESGVPEVHSLPQDTLARLRGMAETIGEIAVSSTSKAFLAAVDDLEEKPRRFVYYDRGLKRVYTQDEYAQLPAPERRGLQLGGVTSLTYYEGQSRRDFPLYTARHLDLALGDTRFADAENVPGMRVFDLQFATPTVGVLLASMGAEVVGVEDDALATKLYNAPSDEGEIDGADGAPGGSLNLVFGNWPGDEDVRREVGGGFDLILIDSTLFKGTYFRPPPRGIGTIPVPPPELGASPEQYVDALYQALKPGGRVFFTARTIPQSRQRMAYRPDLDGRFPFERDVVDRAGFRVIAWGQDDSQTLRDLVRRLNSEGINSGAPALAPLYSAYTILEKPAKDAR